MVVVVVFCSSSPGSRGRTKGRVVQGSAMGEEERENGAGLHRGAWKEEML